MALPVLNITFTALQLTAIDAALTALETSCPFRVNVPAGEKNEDQAMSVKRYPFVQNTINNHAPANANMQPPFILLADARNDLTLFDQFTPRISRLNSIVESYIDTQWVAGTEAYNYFRKFYAIVEQAKTDNVPGADAVYQDLKRLFEDQGTPPNPGP